MREAWPGARVWALAVALCLTLPAGAGSLAGESSSLGEQPSSGDGETDLAAPLVKLATAPGEVAQIRTAYAAGQAWGQAQLADEARVGDAVERLYDVLELEAASTEPVPEAFEAPLRALVALQAHHAAGSGPFAGLSDDQAHAFTLGVLDPVIAAFEETRHEAPEEPVFVDPLGLIVLGGSGDDTYEPHKLGPTSWKGPILLVEPAGNETYNVPVASATQIEAGNVPITGFQYSNIALEFGGNDTYNDRAASSDLGVTTQAILLDRHGGDAYSATGIERTTAHASPGFAYLLDEEGDDEYYAAGEGIAHAYRGGTAVLWDQEGDDAYEAHPDEGRFTHAVAHSRQAEALLWDEKGNDVHQAHLYAYASAWNDAYARFLDEQGNDSYYVEDLALSFGVHFEELVSFVGDNLVGAGLGEFIDGRGDDRYDWQRADEKVPTPWPADETVRSVPWQAYGVFIDCTTPADADRPCEEEQHEARCMMVGHPPWTPFGTKPLADSVLSPVEDQCRGLSP